MKRLIGILLLALLTAGCYSRLTGNKGAVVFAYQAASDLTNFNKPIAPGASLRILVRDVGSDDEVTVVAARSLSPDVLEVTAATGSGFDVKGRTVGSARLEVTVETAAGAEKTDSVDMLVAKPEVVDMRHSCTSEPFAAYPAESIISIPFHLKRKSGQPIIGHGFTPVRIKPKGSLELLETVQEPGIRRFSTGSPKHRVSLRSRIDDGLLGMALVDESEVDDFDLDQFGVGRTVVGGHTFVFFQPTVENVPLCQSQLTIKATTKTPETCRATARLDDDQDDDTNTEHTIRVGGRAFGWCEFEVTYLEANGGDGVSRTFEMPIGEFPAREESRDEHQAPERPVWLAPLLALVAPLLLLPFAARLRHRR